MKASYAWKSLLVVLTVSGWLAYLLFPPVRTSSAPKDPEIVLAPAQISLDGGRVLLTNCSPVTSDVPITYTVETVRQGDVIVVKHISSVDCVALHLPREFSPHDGDDVTITKDWENGLLIRYPKTLPFPNKPKKDIFASFSKTWN